MIEPPQKGVISPEETRPTYTMGSVVIEFQTFPNPTCHGYSLTSVSTPPTILVRLCTKPQVQLVVAGLVVGDVAVVVIDGGVVVTDGAVVVDTTT